MLRRSLIPSLLGARRGNESQQNEGVSLFEIAKIYLPRAAGLPEEPWMLGLVSELDLLEVKGILRAVLAELTRAVELRTSDAEIPLCDENCCQLVVTDKVLGYLGELSAAGQRKFDLRRPATFAELRLDRLEQIAELVPQYRQQSSFPAIRRDLNLIVDDQVRWSALADSVSDACGDLLDTMEYRETFRDVKKDGPNKKRLMFSFLLRAPDRTLTREEADEITAKVVDRCAKQHGAALLS